MCLIINHRNLKTVTTHKEGKPSNDKTVYKVLIHNNSGKIFSPWRRFRITLNELLVDTSPIKIQKVETSRIVTSGYFHSYTNKNKAISIAKEFNDRFTNLKRTSIFKAIVHKVIIPEGAKYYEGTSNDICSNKIIVTSDTL